MLKYWTDRKHAYKPSVIAMNLAVKITVFHFIRVLFILTDLPDFKEYYNSSYKRGENKVHTESAKEKLIKMGQYGQVNWVLLPC